jgi:hypothetical protein
MNDLARLRGLLARALLPPAIGTVGRGPTPLSRSLQRLRQACGSHEGERRGPRLARSLLAFRMSGGRVGFVDLKYACFGAALPADWESRRLLDDERLLGKLLVAVMAWSGDARHFALCYRGLFASHFLAARDAATPLADVVRQRLADFLRRGAVHLPTQRVPAWVVCLRRHPELLADDPARLWQEAWQTARPTAPQQLIRSLAPRLPQ